MLFKLTLSTKLFVFISITVFVSQTATSSSVKGGSLIGSSVSSKSSSSSASSSSSSGKQTHQVTSVSSEPSVSSSKNFRDNLRIKSKLISGGSVPVYSGGSIYKQTRPVQDEEALPEVNLDSSVERTDKSLNSGEEFQRILGAETTSVQPTFDEDVTTSSPPLLLISKKNNIQQEPVQEVEEAELITANRVSHKQHHRIQAAVRTKHTFEYRPVVMDDLQEDIQPRIIEVAAKSVPLEIHFKSASSRIKLVQSHKSGELQEVERTSSVEEPQRLQHFVRKPIIQEVHELIEPRRRIIQEIHPVEEEIHTIISHEKEGRVSGKLTHSKTSSTTSVASKHQQTTQSTSTQKTQQHQQQKVEQQKIPTNWLRPVSNNQISQSSSFSSNNNKQQAKIEQQKISGQNYGPSFNTYPVEVTSTRPLLVNEEADQSEHGSNSEVEDLSDTSIEVVSGNELNNIIPARVMQQIMHEYQARVQAREKAQEQQQQVSRPAVTRPSGPQNTKGQSGFNVQQPQQLRESASSRNSQWSAVRPYVHYNGPQQQQRNFFGPQQHQQNNFNHQQQQQPQNRFNNGGGFGNRY